MASIGLHQSFPKDTPNLKVHSEAILGLSLNVPKKKKKGKKPKQTKPKQKNQATNQQKKPKP